MAKCPPTSARPLAIGGVPGVAPASNADASQMKARAGERPPPSSRTSPSRVASARNSLSSSGAGGAPAATSTAAWAVPRPAALADSR